MNEEIKTYLRSVCKEIKSKEHRRRTYVELRSHILDSIEDKLESGVSFNEAVKYTLSDLANAKKLGRKLELARRPSYLRHPYLLTSFSLSVLFLVSIVIGSYYIVTDILHPAWVNQSAKRKDFYYDKFEKDLELISHRTLFKPSQYMKNAVTALSQSNQEIDAFVKINKTLEQKINSKTVSLINVSSIEGLLEYDHINIFDLEANKKLLNQALDSNGIRKIGLWSSLKLSNLSTLRHQSLIYLIQKFREGNLQQGLKVSSHMASLAFSSSYLSGQLVALKILSDQNRFLKQINSTLYRGELEEVLKAYKRVSWSWPSIIMDIHRKGVLPKRWRKYSRQEFGFCAGVFEGSIGLSGLDDFLRPTIWLETDHREQLEQSQKGLKSLFQTCHISKLEAFQGRTPAGKNQLWDPDIIEAMTMIKPIFKSIPNLSRIPYIRRIVGFYFLNVAYPVFIETQYMVDEKE